MEMSTRVYVTRVVAEQLAERTAEVARHQTVNDRIDGRVCMACNVL